MKLNDKNSPLKVYMIAGHLTWVIISPLLVFIGGGSWLVNRFELASWLMLVFVFLGLFVMICGGYSYLKHLYNMYEGDSSDSDKEKKSPKKVDKRDYDY
jgi:hypothetical protein